jgi:hypothetical protein
VIIPLPRMITGQGTSLPALLIYVWERVSVQARLVFGAPPRTLIPSSPSEARSVRSLAIPQVLENPPRRGRARPATALCRLLLKCIKTIRQRDTSHPRTSHLLMLLPPACFAGLMGIAQAQEMKSPETVIVDGKPYCVDVQVAGAREPAYACLNDQLKAMSQSNPADPNLAIKSVVGDADPARVGTFSHTGTAIQMGNSFGHSAVPQRPVTTYAPPVGAPHG